MHIYKAIVISGLLFCGGATSALALEAENSWQSATAFYMKTVQTSQAPPAPPPPGPPARSFRNSAQASGTPRPEERGSGRDTVSYQMIF